MSVRLPNGAILAMATAYAASKAASAVSNANPAVATLEAAHGIVQGDYFEFLSGWAKATERIFKAGTVSTNDVQVLGLNSASVAQYPAGSGVGSVREVTTWTQIQQITGVSSQGGEQQNTTYQFLESDREQQIPTTKTATSIGLTLGDDATLAGYLALEAANDDRLPRAFRFTFPDGSVLVFSALVSLNKVPTLNINEIMTVTGTLSLRGDPVRYSA